MGKNQVGLLKYNGSLGCIKDLFNKSLGIVASN